MINKKSYIVNMTYNVSDEEKHQAEKAIICLNHIEKLTNISLDHLDLMKVPFEKDSNISSDELIESRAALRRFRDKSLENFTNFKLFCFKFIDIMETFSSDDKIIKLMNSFVGNIENIEEEVNSFYALFDNFNNDKFASNAVEYINNIEEKCVILLNFIDERVKSYIKSNILSSNWVDNIGNEMQIELTQKTPLLVDLYNKQQNQLNKL